MEHIAWPGLAAVLRIVLVAAALWLAVKALRVAVGRLERRLGERAAGAPAAGESTQRAQTLVRLLHQGAVLLLWAVAALMVLRELGVDITPILAGAGIAGLAVGFGAQSLVRDVLAGFFLILEDQVRVGDVAVVNGTGGLVEAIRFRTLVLRDLSGTVHIFPNGSITSLANLTRDWSAYVFEVGVSYRADVDAVMELMREVGRQLREDPHFGPLMLEDVEIFGVDDFADSAVIIKGRLKTRPIKQWEVGREYRRRLKQAFDRAGIEIPFPQRTLSFAEGAELLARVRPAAPRQSPRGPRPA